MGILFSRPGRDVASLPPGTYAAGNLTSLNGSNIAPYIGANTGVYADIPLQDLPPIPFEWIISPSTVNDETTSCPTPLQIMTLFAVSEAVVTLGTLLLAYRPVVNFLSMGHLGRRLKNSVAYTWTGVFVCHLLGNATVAWLIGSAQGYGGLNMLHIFTVSICRPRFNFVVLSLLRSLVGVQRPRSMDKTTIIRPKVDERVEFPYTDAYIASTIADLFLLLIAALFTGVTWNRMPGTAKQREYMDDLISYAESTPGVICLVMLAFVPVYKRYGDAFPLEGRRYDMGRRWGVTVAHDGTATIGVKRTGKRKSGVKKVASAVSAGVLMGYVCLVWWAYWTRFLDMPGVLFCPPKMVQSGVVWTVFNLAGIVIGAAS